MHAKLGEYDPIQEHFDELLSNGWERAKEVTRTGKVLAKSYGIFGLIEMTGRVVSTSRGLFFCKGRATKKGYFLPHSNDLYIKFL